MSLIRSGASCMVLFMDQVWRARRPPAQTVPVMAVPVLAVAGVVVGALGSGAVLLAGVAGSMALGPFGPYGPSRSAALPTAFSAAPPAGGASPAISPTLMAELEQTAAAACPGLDWALLGGAALSNPSAAADVASVATDLCTYLPGDRPAALA